MLLVSIDRKSLKRGGQHESLFSASDLSCKGRQQVWYSCKWWKRMTHCILIYILVGRNVPIQEKDKSFIISLAAFCLFLTLLLSQIRWNNRNRGKVLRRASIREKPVKILPEVEEKSCPNWKEWFTLSETGPR